MGITGTVAGTTTVTIENVNVSVTTVAEQVVEYTAGEALLAKAVVCVGESDGKLYNAKADSSTTMPAIGINKDSVATNETAYVFQTGKVTGIKRDGDFSYDDLVFVSPLNAGQLTKTVPQTTGQFSQSVGRSINASDLVLSIDQTYLEIV